MSSEINLIGDVPQIWYRQFAHVGYNVDAQRLMQVDSEDSLSALLASVDDRSSWRKIVNTLSGNLVRLSRAEIILLHRIQSGGLPAGLNENNLHISSLQLYQGHTLHDVTPKRRFQPSKWEAKIVKRLVRALRSKHIFKNRTENNDSSLRDIWKESMLSNFTLQCLRARKCRQPGNQNSFNPPVEYMNSVAEVSELPKTLRKVRAHGAYIQEQFERCLDLYLCPRLIKSKVTMVPEDLLPKIPSPQQLKPFPEVNTQTYLHADAVNSISVHWSGEWVACSDRSGHVSIWEVQSGRCITTLQLQRAASAVSWHPTSRQSLIAICIGTCVLICNPFDENVNHLSLDLSTRAIQNVSWEFESSKSICIIRHQASVAQVVWHVKGNYFATVCDNEMGINLHSFEAKRSHQMFSRQESALVAVLFHPSKPLFLICSRKMIRIYNLRTHDLVKKISKGMSENTCMCLSLDGCTLLVGNDSGRLLLYDFETSGRCKVVSAHSTSISSISQHQLHPLIATVARDGNVNLFHIIPRLDMDMEMVILPVKVFKSAVVEIQHARLSHFHPTQPWVFLQNGGVSIELFSEDQM